MSKQDSSLQQILNDAGESAHLTGQSRGWSIEELAARTSLPAGELRAIEQGEDFSMGCLKPLCDVYEVEPIVELFRPMTP